MNLRKLICQPKITLPNGKTFKTINEANAYQMGLADAKANMENAVNISIENVDACVERAELSIAQERQAEVASDREI